MTPFLNPTYIIAVLIAVSIHEWAHAMVASKLGDPTPEAAGRLTLNPIAHLDLVGALLFITVGFGWAKPVPVSSGYFRHPKRDLSLVALAGPFSNLILAIIAFTLLSVLTPGNGLSVDTLLGDASVASPVMTLVLQILRSSLFVNLALMAFNLFPLAPLDGSNIIQMFVPPAFEDRYQEFARISPFILLGLVFLGSYLPFDILGTWVFSIVGFVLSVMQGVAGVL